MTVQGPVGPGDPFEAYWTPSRPQSEEDAFNLKDVSRQYPEEFSPDMFIGRDVTMNVKIVRAIDAREGQFLDLTHTVSFYGGEDEEEFWDNYHEAVREAIARNKEESEEWAEENDLDVEIEDTSRGAGVRISGMAVSRF